MVFQLKNGLTPVSTIFYNISQPEADRLTRKGPDLKKGRQKPKTPPQEPKTSPQESRVFRSGLEVFLSFFRGLAEKKTRKTGLVFK